jgi:hypothetical protein
MRYKGTTTTTDGWMVYGHDTFFHWVLVHELNSLEPPRVQKLRFIQLDGLKMGKYWV